MDVASLRRAEWRLVGRSLSRAKARPYNFGIGPLRGTRITICGLFWCEFLRVARRPQGG
jgi:hypothetical protein